MSESPSPSSSERKAALKAKFSRTGTMTEIESDAPIAVGDVPDVGESPTAAKKRSAKELLARTGTLQALEKNDGAITVDSAGTATLPFGSPMKEEHWGSPSPTKSGMESILPGFSDTFGGDALWEKVLDGYFRTHVYVEFIETLLVDSPYSVFVAESDGAFATKLMSKFLRSNKRKHLPDKLQDEASREPGGTKEATPELAQICKVILSKPSAKDPVSSDVVNMMIEFLHGGVACAYMIGTEFEYWFRVTEDFLSSNDPEPTKQRNELLKWILMYANKADFLKRRTKAAIDAHTEYESNRKKYHDDLHERITENDEYAWANFSSSASDTDAEKTKFGDEKPTSDGAIVPWEEKLERAWQALGFPCHFTNMQEVFAQMFDAADESGEGHLLHADVYKLLMAALVQSGHLSFTEWDVAVLMSHINEGEGNGNIAYIPFVHGGQLSDLIDNLRKRRELYLERYPERADIRRMVLSNNSAEELPDWAFDSKMTEAIEMLEGAELDETCRLLLQDLYEKFDGEESGYVRRSDLLTVLRSYPERLSPSETGLLMQLVEEVTEFVPKDFHIKEGGLAVFPPPDAEGKGVARTSARTSTFGAATTAIELDDVDPDLIITYAGIVDIAKRRTVMAAAEAQQAKANKGNNFATQIGIDTSNRGHLRSNAPVTGSVTGNQLTPRASPMDSQFPGSPMPAGLSSKNSGFVAASAVQSGMISAAAVSKKQHSGCAGSLAMSGKKHTMHDHHRAEDFLMPWWDPNSPLADPEGNSPGRLLRRSRELSSVQAENLQQIVLCRYDNLREIYVSLRLQSLYNPLLESDTRIVRRRVVVQVRLLQLEQKTPIWMWRHVLLRLENLILSRFQVHIILCAIPCNEDMYIDVPNAVAITTTLIHIMSDPESYYDTSVELQIEAEKLAVKRDLEELQEMNRRKSGNAGAKDAAAKGAPAVAVIGVTAPSGAATAKSEQNQRASLPNLGAPDGTVLEGLGSSDNMDLDLRDNMEEVVKNLISTCQAMDSDKSGMLSASTICHIVQTDWQNGLSGGGLTTAEIRGFVAECLGSQFKADEVARITRRVDSKATSIEGKRNESKQSTAKKIPSRNSQSKIGEQADATDAEQISVYNDLSYLANPDDVKFSEHIKNWIPVIFECRKNAFYRVVVRNDDIFEPASDDEEEDTTKLSTPTPPEQVRKPSRRASDGDISLSTQQQEAKKTGVVGMQDVKGIADDITKKVGANRKRSGSIPDLQTELAAGEGAGAGPPGIGAQGDRITDETESLSKSKKSAMTGKIKLLPMKRYEKEFPVFSAMRGRLASKGQRGGAQNALWRRRLSASKETGGVGISKERGHSKSVFGPMIGSISSGSKGTVAGGTTRGVASKNMRSIKHSASKSLGKFGRHGSKEVLVEANPYDLKPGESVGERRRRLGKEKWNTLRQGPGSADVLDQ